MRVRGELILASFYLWRDSGPDATYCLGVEAKVITGAESCLKRSELCFDCGAGHWFLSPSRFRDCQAALKSLLDRLIQGMRLSTCEKGADAGS